MKRRVVLLLFVVLAFVPVSADEPIMSVSPLDCPPLGELGFTSPVPIQCQIVDRMDPIDQQVETKESVARFASTLGWLVLVLPTG